jgi:hypothetical protein
MRKARPGLARQIIFEVCRHDPCFENCVATIFARSCEKILKKQTGPDFEQRQKIKILVVLLRQKYPILRHGHKKTRQEKGEEEEQEVTFALPPLSLFTNTGPQGRCFFVGKLAVLKTRIDRGLRG